VRRILESEAAATAALRITPSDLDLAQKTLDAIETYVTGATPIDYDAVMEADIEFHRIIARCSGNPALEALINALGNRTIRSRTWHAISDSGAVPSAQRDHRGILEALRQHEPEHARLRMAIHLLNVEEFIYAHPTDVISEE
jgi:DNA-binding FadR family transcriptional regulator